MKKKKIEEEVILKILMKVKNEKVLKTVNHVIVVKEKWRNDIDEEWKIIENIEEVMK